MKRTRIALLVSITSLFPMSTAAVDFDDLPPLVLCEPSSGSIWTPQSEVEPAADDTVDYRCGAVCQGTWQTCAIETSARGRAQRELYFVVQESGRGATAAGMAGTLRLTRDGNPQELVFFHKGGSGVDWSDEYLPGEVERLGHTAAEVKWEDGSGTKGWFTRPTRGASLPTSLEGISQRPAAVIRWLHANASQDTEIGTVGCSGGSIATYYPRHWHGADQAIRYQLLMGGPVMAHINDACGGGSPAFEGRCSQAPSQQCDRSRGCSGFGNRCVEYEWAHDLVMGAVRDTLGHLHSIDTVGATDCADGIHQTALDASDFANGSAFIDAKPGHTIDFVMDQTLGIFTGDDDLNVLSHGALIHEFLPASATTWTVHHGHHCDSLDSQEAWDLLRAGMGW